MSYVWIVPDKLAQGPLPSISDLSCMAEVFDAFIILVMEHEVPGGIDYYLSVLISYGIDYLYVPTPDFHPLQLLELYITSRYIEEKINNGERVFVHCMGGIGRSGLVTASYLVFKGYDLYRAVQYVRERVPGAVENYGQMRMLENFYLLMRSIDRGHFNKIFDLFRKYSSDKEFRHSSKSIQLVIELADLFKLIIDKSLYKVILASMLHCMQDHDKIQSLLENTCIRESNECKELVSEVIRILENWKKPTSRDELIVLVSHLLDYTYDQRVVFTDLDIHRDLANITLYCDYGCKIVIDKINELSHKINEIIGRKIVFTQQSYMDSI